MWQNELFRSLGMSLLHSLWEGAVIFVILQLCLSLAGKNNASIRYVIHFSGLLALAAAFFATWYVLYASGHYAVPAESFRSAAAMPPEFHGMAILVTGRLSLWGWLNQFVEPLSPFLAMGWLVGFPLVALYTSVTLFVSYRSVRSGLLTPDDSMRLVFRRACQRLDIRNGFLYLTAQQVSPMVLGIFKPMVIIPMAVVNGLSTEQVEAVMVHELAHIRRLDPVFLVIQALAVRILFFHPLAWYLSAQIDSDREHSCDDLVLHTFSDPINYIKALTMIQEMNMSPVPVNALTGKSKQLLGRAMRLLTPESGRFSSFRTAILLLLLISFGLTAFAMVYASSPRQVKQDPPAAGPAVARVEKDTVKQVIIRKEVRQVDPKTEKEREKELSEARRQLEKAQIALLKAQQELERANEQMRMTREKYAPGDMFWVQRDQPDLYEWKAEPFNAPMEFHFDMEKNKAFQEQMMKLQQEMKQNQEEMYQYQLKMMPEQREEMKRQMEEQFRLQGEFKQLQEEKFKELQEEWEREHPGSGMPMLPPMPEFKTIPDSMAPEINKIIRLKIEERPE